MNVLATRSWLEYQYDLNAEALVDLGFDQAVVEEEIPAFEEILRRLGNTGLEWLADRRALGHVDDLVVSPSVQRIGVNKDQNSLIPRYDLKGNSKSSVSGAWGRFKVGDPLHDNGQEEWPAAILLGDVTDPIDPTEPANELDENGLVYTRLNSAAQREVFNQEKAEVEAAGLTLSPASIGEIVTVNAKRRQAGISLLDEEHSLTRLVRYPDTRAKTIAKTSLTVSSRSNGRLSVAHTFSSFRFKYCGIRRSIVIEPESSDFE